MIRVSFDGAEITAEAGETLLVAGQRAGQPLEGTCNGQIACATCHVVVAADWVGRLAPPSAEEEDMLDLVVGAVRTSRLACQVRLSPELDGLAVRLP